MASSNMSDGEIAVKPVRIVDTGPASTEQVEEEIERAHKDGYVLTHMSMALDADHARFYTLIFELRPMWISQAHIESITDDSIIARINSAFSEMIRR